MDCELVEPPKARIFIVGRIVCWQFVGGDLGWFYR